MGSASPDAFDLLIVGAGPAGTAAALHARKLGATALLVEAEALPRPRHCTGWLGPAAIELCTSLGVTAKKSGAAEFKGMRLHSWDLKKNVVLKDADLAGWVVSRDALDQALARAAEDAGATLRSAGTISELSIRDDRVGAKLSDGQLISAKLLLIADGTQSATARMAHMVPAGGQRDVSSSCFAEFSQDKAAVGVDVAVSSGRSPLVATIVRSGKHVRVSITARGAANALESGFRTFIPAAQSAGLIPAGAAVPIRRVLPAGVALDMDSHVGKRSLLIGDAGGFVASFSGEGIYPAMRSGCIAAEIGCKAIASKLPQDELATFEEAWRTALADYIRMPNTDLSLLMPLVFNNPQMSLRVARAFLLGQQF